MPQFNGYIIKRDYENMKKIKRHSYQVLIVFIGQAYKDVHKRIAAKKSCWTNCCAVKAATP
jgi:hypothetical protein